MNAQDNGGPAFPVTTGNITMLGMTLRDWFAGQALAGMVACPTIRGGTTAVECAETCYGLADAMLAERSAKP